MIAILKQISTSARALRKSPGFAATAIVTLALGIGPTTAIFSVADAMLWKPVPLPNLDRLAVVTQRVVADPHQWNSISTADSTDILRQSTAFENLAFWANGMANIAPEGADPLRAIQVYGTANFFDVVGVRPAIGRGFAPGEDEPGRERVVVLSDKLWKRNFGASPSVLGANLRLDDDNYLIIGVMPPNFEFPIAAEVWTPLAVKPEQRGVRTVGSIIGIGRLKPGQTPERAQAELDVIASGLERSYPETNRNRRFMAMPVLRFLVGDYSHDYMIMLLGAVVFVLMIACSNVANLQFARAAARARETALRTALGAGRWRLISLVIAESLLLATAGAALGLLLAQWGITTIRNSMPPDIRRYVLGWETMSLDGRTLLFTLGAAVLSGVAAGLAPAWHFSRPNLSEMLKEGGRGSSAGRARQRLRTLLVGAEIALAVVLLVGAGLMVRGFRNIFAAGTSFEPSTMLTLRMAITDTKYAKDYEVATFYRQVLDRLAVIPGVRSAVAATALPYSGHSNGTGFAVEGQTLEPGRTPTATLQAVTPNYLQTMHIPLRGGRQLSESDGPDAPPVALVSERLAARWWPGQPYPIGRRIRLGPPGSNSPWTTIVGVTADAPQDFYDRTPRSTIYLPFAQSPRRWVDIGLRAATGDPLTLAGAAIAAVRSVDPQAPVSDLRTLEKAIHDNGIGLTYVAVLMGVLGAIALLLSCVGVYGVMSYVVAQQTNEIGVRMALGATARDIMQMLFRRGMAPALSGMLIGLTGSYGLARLLQALVFGVDATDPATFAGIPLALAAAAAFAVYIPARRAVKIEPMAALRCE